MITIISKKDYNTKLKQFELLMDRSGHEGLNEEEEKQLETLSNELEEYEDKKYGFVPNYVLCKDLIVRIDTVYPNDWNPKDTVDENPENKKIFQAIKKELESKGQLEAITVRELDNGKGGKYQILDGYHRWLATVELGRNYLKVNNLGIIDDNLARAITVVKEEKRVPLSKIKVADLINSVYLDSGEDKAIVADIFGYPEESIDEYLKVANTKWQDNTDEYPTQQEQSLEEKNENSPAKTGIKETDFRDLLDKALDIFESFMNREDVSEELAKEIENIVMEYRLPIEESMNDE